ncbi:MAG: hypothetical protein R3Y57_04875 [Erysipelotrichaceae bacterium]
MKNLKWIVLSTLVVISTIYFTMTPIGALRFEILTLGHPISAFTFEVMDESNYMTLNENQLGYSLDNAPFEEPTQSELINWVVTKHGLFYSANYYGWG